MKARLPARTAPPGQPRPLLRSIQTLSNPAAWVAAATPEATAAPADLYTNYYNSMVRFYFCDAMTAEVTKYMENAFYAVKVTFANEFHDIARAHGVEYNLLREIWLADPRISRDHTDVYPEARGFAGKCLPKDLRAIIRSSEARGVEATLLKATAEANEAFLARNGGPESVRT